MVLTLSILEMSLCDPYRELELYLKQVENEIMQVFENGVNDVEEKSDILDNNSIKSDDSSYLILDTKSTKNDFTEILSCYNLQGDDGIYNINDEKVVAFSDNNDIYLDPSSDVASLSNSITVNDCPINAATQTSPSLSPSSTNLTWASECSSSPCLTSTSDSDHLDDDSQSTSSTDGRELLVQWGGGGGGGGGGGCQHRWQQVLSAKSSSAPVLKKVPIKVSKQARSQSDRHLAEIEAAEACKWLRATGFPQYAQMYEDMQFPVDISTAAQDHPLLEQDVLHSLFRRLQILNNCVHLHQQRVTHHTDESEDEYCALSDNWTYQTDIRRWSRTCKTIQLPNTEHFDQQQQQQQQQKKDEIFVSSATQSPKDKLKRAGSTKFRRRRDGLVFSDSNGSKILDTLSQQLSELKSCEIKPVSDSECTPIHNRKSRTKSFDKSDTWSHPQATNNDRLIWQKVPSQIDDKPLHTVKSLDIDNNGYSLWSLSCTQLQVLKKLALLKLTAHMEKYCPSHRTGWNWDLPKFIRKIKGPVYKDKNVFGVPITITLQRTGQSLPKPVEEALIWLQQNAYDQVGIFRKPGVKSRIQMLRNMIETNNTFNFNDQQSYDVADMVKQYFRELPETLLTNKLSETFILIFQYVPTYLRRESVLCAILLMPDEHVQVLQVLLNFLLLISKHSSINQMNESNLATCFAPSLFHYSQFSQKQNLGTPHPKELAENKAGQDCLLYFLKHNNTLFQVPKEFVKQCKSSEFKESSAVTLSELGRNMGGWREYLNECSTALIKESKDKNRGWVIVSGHNQKVEISYKKVDDGHPLRLWKISSEVEAPPTEVLHRVLRERHIWDPELQSARIVSQIDKNVEIFHYIRRNLLSLPNEEFFILRKWKTDLPKGACLVVETSIEYPQFPSIPNTVRGIVLASRYLIEPCGSGKSRILYLSRVDIMGKAPEWYQKNYGHICALFIGNITNSFLQTATGPESKV